MKTLKKIYRELGINETYHSEEYKEECKEMNDLKSFLEISIPSQLAENFSDYTNIIAKILSMNSEECFISGMWFGIEMFSEMVYQDKNQR